MSATKAGPTPGPWWLIADDWHYHTLSTVVGGKQRGNSGPHALLVQVGGWDADVQEANARLIAAAPDLLQALQWCARALPHEHPAAEKARVAIAKAVQP